MEDARSDIDVATPMGDQIVVVTPAAMRLQQSSDDRFWQKCVIPSAVAGSADMHIPAMSGKVQILDDPVDPFLSHPLTETCC